MPPRASKPPHVVTGRVVAAHGVLGWVKVEPLTTNPRRFQAGSSFILEGREGGDRLVLEEVREGRGVLLARFQGCDDRNQAEAMVGRELMVERDELGECPEDAYWESDIIGLEVHTRDGRYLGVVAEVMETGANDVLVVEGEGTGEVLIPMIEEVVVHVDAEGGRMVIEPIPGLLEE
jgi:16S rRNA processing protein RimM